MKFFRITLFALTAIIGLSSCSKDLSESDNVVQKRIRDAWIRVNHPNAKSTESGIYYLDETPGYGEAVTDCTYVFVNYTIQTLDGTYSTTTTKEMAQRLGSYSDTTYYAPKIWTTGVYTLYDGVEEVLKQMKLGGKITAVMPPELTLVTYPANYSSYYSSNSQAYSVNTIYNIEIVNMTKDIGAYQIARLEDYSDKYYEGLDSLSEGFYFTKIKELADADTLVEDSSYNVWYIGRLLDGFVFDTNIEDTAKKYHRYNSSTDYDAIEITYHDDLSTFVDENSLVEGFSKAILNMKEGEKAITFFWSDLGYGSSGSGTSIPAYEPLVFEIYIEPSE